MYPSARIDRLRSATDALLPVTTHANGHSVSNTYGLLGNLLSVTDASGATTRSVRYRHGTARVHIGTVHNRLTILVEDAPDRVG